MKQLHKQYSNLTNSSPLPHSTSKTSKPSSSSSSSSRSSLPRSFAQRLLFLLLGALIASTLFLIQPFLSSSSSNSSSHPFTTSSHLPIPSSSSSSFSYSRQQRPVGPKRVPVGLKKPSKRIVVTGGAGFVGSHLVDRLLERGDSVIVIDNFFTGRKENLVHRFGDPRFELIRHDVVEPILLEVDQIYHLACPASPVHYKYNPIKTIISFFGSFFFIAFSDMVLF